MTHEPIVTQPGPIPLQDMVWELEQVLYRLERLAYILEQDGRSNLAISVRGWASGINVIVNRATEGVVRS